MSRPCVSPKMSDVVCQEHRFGENSNELSTVRIRRAFHGISVVFLISAHGRRSKVIPDKPGEQSDSIELPKPSGPKILRPRDDRCYRNRSWQVGPPLFLQQSLRLLP